MRLNTNDGNIWFTSDTHFNHTNIVKGISKWKKGGMRDMNENLEYMNTLLLEEINKRVQPNDTLIHLGDFAFGDKTQIPHFLDRILCKNVHLVFGNHDHWIRAHYKHLFKSVHELLELTIVEAQPIVNGRQQKAKKYNFVLCHYPLFVWNGHMKGWIHLHGHCHNSMYHTTPDYYKRKAMDVGVDTIFNQFGYYGPISYSHIMELLRNKELVEVDHHDANTNVY